MTANPLVSVVVPARNRAGELAECLRSLQEQTYPQDRVELLVVDNGSTDQSAEVARAGGATVLREETPGAGRARNRGIEAASGDLIAFIDSDCRADGRWLERIVAPFDSDEGLGVCGGALRAFEPATPLERYIAEMGLMSQEAFLKAERFSFPFFMTANAAFRKEALERVGGFDTALATAGEDADLCWRVTWAGYSWRYVPEAIAHHKHRTTLKGFCRQVYGYGLGTVDLFKKHRERFEGPVPFDARRYREAVAACWRLAFKRWRLRGDARDRLLYECLSRWSFNAGRLHGCLKNRVWFP